MAFALLFIVIFAGGFLWFLSRPAKKVIVIPVSQNGVISQQSFLAEKTTWKVLWESDAINAVRVMLDLFGILMLAGWLWG